MKKAIYRKQPFLDYQSIIMIYNGENEKYLAHSFIYNGRDAEYLLFLYKQPLPKMKFIEAWNYLDDNAFDTTIVPVPSLEQAIDDFLAVWKPDCIQESIEIIEVSGFSEIEKLLEDKTVFDKELLFFGRK